MTNPYQPPMPETDDAYPRGRAQTPTIFILAAIGAWLAGAYWGLLTLLIAVGVATGATSFIQTIIPAVLIFLYVGRGYQLFKGNLRAMNSLVGLHAVGGIIGLMNAYQAQGLLVALHGVKVAIHIFGGLTVYLALQHAKKNEMMAA